MLCPDEGSVVVTDFRQIVLRPSQSTLSNKCFTLKLMLPFSLLGVFDSCESCIQRIHAFSVNDCLCLLCFLLCCSCDSRDNTSQSHCLSVCHRNAPSDANTSEKNNGNTTYLSFRLLIVSLSLSFLSHMNLTMNLTVISIASEKRGSKGRHIQIHDAFTDCVDESKSLKKISHVSIRTVLKHKTLMISFA